MPRRRRLSPEERKLWQQVAATATPLRPPAAGEVVPADPAPTAAPPTPAVADTGGTPPPRTLRPVGRASAGRVTVDLAPDSHALPVGAHTQMDRGRFEKLRRGRLDPEARLDLHGMTAERAHGALVSFILGAHADGLRLVLVITGKGRPDEHAIQPHRHGILRHSLPHWLTAPPLTGRVLQTAPAHQRHGGAGAFYVYLRRHRA